MKVLVICAATLSAVLAAPTYSQDGPFDHFTEVFDDNIAMPTAPEAVASQGPSAIRFFPEHREIAAPIAAARPIRPTVPQPIGVVAPIPAKKYYPNQQPYRQTFNLYDNYPVNPFYNPYQNPFFFFKDNQYPVYQPQGFPSFFPYQSQQQPSRPIFVPLKQGPSFGFGPSSPGVTVVYIAGMKPPVQPVQSPVKETEEALIVETRPVANADVAKEDPEKEFGSEKNVEAAVEGKVELEDSPDEFEQGSLQEEDLFVTNAKEAVEMEADAAIRFEGSGSESDAEIVNDEKKNLPPISLLNFSGSKSASVTSVKQKDATTVEAATEEEIEEFEGLSVRNPFPDEKDIFVSNAKDNEVLMQMILGAKPNTS